MKSGVLNLVIVVSIILFLITGFLYLILYNNLYLINRLKVFKQQELNLQSVVSLIENRIISTKDSVYNFQLYGTDNDSAKVILKNWGVYDIAYISIKHKANEIKKVALLGVLNDSLSSAALYLTDYNRPLIISGNTKITGDVYLPKAGVRSGFVNGIGYRSDTLIHGIIMESKSSFPKIDTSRLSKIANIQSAFNENRVSDYLTNSNYKSILVNEMESITQHLSNYNLILSRHPIVLKEKIEFNNHIIIAPSVIINGDVTGFVQIFSTDSIIIHNNTRLSYPSTLNLINFSDPNKISKIIVREGAEVSAAIFSYNLFNEFNPIKIELQNKAIIKGQIVSDGEFELNGNVHGNVICNKFTLNRNFTLYENYLFNSTINRKLLTNNFVTTSVLLNGSKLKLIKWLE